jgi:hypothetical protein
LELSEFINAINGSSKVENGTSNDAIEIMKLTDYVYNNFLLDNNVENNTKSSNINAI